MSRWPDLTDAQRFAMKIHKGDGCWLWMGGKDSSGYGTFHTQDGTVGAHRWAYLTSVGAIPPDLEIDHLCGERSCVNPSHMEAVTHAVNVARSSNSGAVARRTNRCHLGHSLADAYCNNGKRFCRTCSRARGQRQAAKVSALRAQRRLERNRAHLEEDT